MLSALALGPHHMQMYTDVLTDAGGTVETARGTRGLQGERLEL